MQAKSSYLDTSGAAGAEMALMLPLLIGLMFGSFELGHYFWTEHQVVKAVREGSRFAARQPFSKYACNSTNLADTTLETRIKNLTRTGTVDGTGPVKIRGWTNQHVTVTVSCPTTALTSGIYKAVSNAPRVTVAASVPYSSLFGLLGFTTSQLTLGARAQAAVMGV